MAPTRRASNSNKQGVEVFSDEFEDSGCERWARWADLESAFTESPVGCKQEQRDPRSKKPVQGKGKGKQVKFQPENRVVRASRALQAGRREGKGRMQRARLQARAFKEMDLFLDLMGVSDAAAAAPDPEQPSVLELLPSPCRSTSTLSTQSGTNRDDTLPDAGRASASKSLPQPLLSSCSLAAELISKSPTMPASAADAGVEALPAVEDLLRSLLMHDDDVADGQLDQFREFKQTAQGIVQELEVLEASAGIDMDERLDRIWSCRVKGSELLKDLDRLRRLMSQTNAAAAAKRELQSSFDHVFKLLVPGLTGGLAALQAAVSELFAQARAESQVQVADVAAGRLLREIKATAEVFLREPRAMVAHEDISSQLARLAACVCALVESAGRACSRLAESLLVRERLCHDVQTQASVHWPQALAAAGKAAAAVLAHAHDCWLAPRLTLDLQLLRHLLGVVKCALEMHNGWQEEADKRLWFEVEEVDMERGMVGSFLEEKDVQIHAWVGDLYLLLMDRLGFLHWDVSEALLQEAAAEGRRGSPGSASPEPPAPGACRPLLLELQGCCSRLVICNTRRMALLCARHKLLPAPALRLLFEQAKKALQLFKKWDESTLGLRCEGRENDLLLYSARENLKHLTNGFLRIKDKLHSLSLSQCKVRDSPFARVVPGGSVPAFAPVSPPQKAAGKKKKQRGAELGQETKLIPWSLLIGSLNGSNVRLLGNGSCGQVFMCPYEGQRVAAKLMRIPEGEFDDNVLTSFKKEVHIQQNLSHKNIVKLLGACCEHEGDEERLYTSPNLAIVMELCDFDLWHLITKAREVQDKLREGVDPLLLPPKLKPAYGFYRSWATRLEVAHGIAAGLEHMHRRECVHRDLTSYNVLIRQEPGCLVAKLCDFNYSQVLPPGQQLRKSERTANSPRWQSPEILSRGCYGHPSDVFSLGVILWEIITLQVPWKLSEPQLSSDAPARQRECAEWIHDHEIGAKVSKGSRLELPDPATLQPALPLATATSLLSLVRSCWEHEPSQRPVMHRLTESLAAAMASVRDL